MTPFTRNLALDLVAEVRLDLQTDPADKDIVPSQLFDLLDSMEHRLRAIDQAKHAKASSSGLAAA